MNNIKIISNGTYLPKTKLINNELADKLNIEENFILKRTGIQQRYYALDETIEEMAIQASIQAIQNSKLNNEEIDMIIVATTSSSNLMPGISYKIQKELDTKNCMCLDILAGCSGYINAFDIARNYIAIGKIEKALIVGVDILSKYLDKKDIGTSIVLSDGAGATIIGKTEESKMYQSQIQSLGQEGELLIYDENKKIRMDGTKTYRYAVTKTVKNIHKLLDTSKVDLSEIKYIVPHQSNLRIMKNIATKLEIDISKMYINIDQYGNSFCATIPIALNEMFEKGLLKKGDKIILLGYGGGLNTGSILLEI